MPAIVKQTAKQAKAAYKARGRPTLSDKELRQIQRAAELEERADRLKEVEKRRAEQAKKKAEQDKRGDEQLRLGTQRRYDRFGFKGSQFHLGAFFGKTDTQPVKSKTESLNKESEQNGDQDMFGEDGLDDDMLLQALDSSVLWRDTRDRPLARSQTFGCQDTAKRLTEAPGSLQRARSAPETMQQEDLSSFLDELSSSTQIARELDDYDGTTKAGKASRSSSFSSDEFDLTAEDLAELDLPTQPSANKGMPSTIEIVAEPRARFDRTIRLTLPEDIAHLKRKTPPPPAPPTAMDIRRQEAARLMPPPPIPPRQLKIRIAPEKLRSIPAPAPQATRPTATQIRSNKRASVGVMLPPSMPFMRRTATSGVSPRRTHLLRTSQPRVTSEPTHPPSIKNKPRTVQSSHAPSSEAAEGTRSSPSAAQGKPPNAIRGPFLPASSLYCPPDLGFTLSQLESFVDDEIQLSQPAPG